MNLHQSSPQFRRVKICNLWTEAEDELVRQHFQNRRALEAMLPYRTAGAIKSRVRDLGLTLNMNFVAITAKDAMRIRQLSKTCNSYQQIADSLGKKVSTIRMHMKTRGIYTSKPEPKITGFPLVDAIRQRAFQLKITLRDFDRSLGSRSRYFSKANESRKISHRQIDHAAKALGGRLVIVWDDSDENTKSSKAGAV